MSARDSPAVISVDGAPPPRGPFVCAVPGTAAPVVVFDLPRGVAGRARLRIAAEQLADRLGGAAEDMDVIPLGGPDWRRAIVCAAADRAGWIAAAAARHRRCRAVLPEHMTLPAAGGVLVLRARDGLVHARMGTQDGFTAPAALAPALLGRLVAEHAPLAADLGPGLPDDVREAAGDLPPPPEPPRAFESGELDADLRRAGRDSGRGTLLLWAASAALTVLAFALWAAGVAAETRALREAAARTRTEAVALLRQGLIPDGPIVDIRQQATRTLEGARGADGATPADLLSRATVGLFGTGAEVGAIAFDVREGLTIDVAASDFAAIARLTRALEEAGAPAEAEGLRARGADGVAARLRVRSGP